MPVIGFKCSWGTGSPTLIASYRIDICLVELALTDTIFSKKKIGDVAFLFIVVISFIKSVEHKQFCDMITLSSLTMKMSKGSNCLFLFSGQKGI
jgi:hypothetical protein